MLHYRLTFRVLNGRHYTGVLPEHAKQVTSARSCGFVPFWR